MKILLPVCTLCLAISIGCAPLLLIPQKMYMHPISNENGSRSQIVSAYFNQVTFHTSVTMGGGIKCEGKLKIVGRGETSNALEAGFKANSIDTWDKIFGTGFYRSTILGSRIHVSGTIHGPNDARLYMEVFKSEIEGAVPQGIAIDHLGNEYKIAF